MDAVTRRQIDERLEDLYRRHLKPGEADAHVAGYYASDRGYYEPAQADGERDRFAVCLVGVEGEVIAAGDRAVPSRCTRCRRCSRTGWRSRSTGATRS